MLAYDDQNDADSQNSSPYSCTKLSLGPSVLDQQIYSSWRYKKKGGNGNYLDKPASYNGNINLYLI